LFIALQPWGERLADWMGNWIWGLGLALPVTFVPLLFPDGHLPSLRWRPVAWIAGLGIGAFVIGSAFAPGRLSDCDCPSINPFGFGGAIGHAVFGAMRPAGLFLSLLMVPAALASLVFRYRRADGAEREQLRWLIFAGVFVGLGIVSSSLVGRFVSNPNIATDISNAIVSVAATAIPIAIGIAILKYRLYDIDVVLNKTVVYGSLAAFITIVYVAIVVGLGALIGRGAQDNPALAIAATAIVAVAFQPVRERVQRFANRLVYGDRATPYQVLAEFSERVAGTYATEDVLPRTARVLAEGTGAARSEVWLRIGSSLQLAAAWPEMSGGPAPHLPMPADGLPVLPDVDRAVPVSHGEELLGAVAVRKPAGEPLSPAEGRLLDDLAAQAGLVLSNVRLTTELEARLDRIAAQAAELRASRQRIVAAQDAERRRLERNIHDGAQQHLVALAVKLRLTKGLIRKDPGRARAMLAEIREETGDAIDTLTDLSRGIYPSILEEQGIAAALAAQYTRSSIPVGLSSKGVRRYPIEIEAAVYFCCLEALQNASKYADATSVQIELREVDSAVEFEVRDDGAGFDPATTARGTGLNSMADRLSVLGGDVEIGSEPGRGTVVRGRLPIGGAEVLR
jgi:signal transduction histidine kinase